MANMLYISQTAQLSIIKKAKDVNDNNLFTVLYMDHPEKDSFFVSCKNLGKS